MNPLLAQPCTKETLSSAHQIELPHKPEEMPIFTFLLLLVLFLGPLVLAGLGHHLDWGTHEALVLAANKLERFLAHVVRMSANGPFYFPRSLINALA